jgi:hypothetical protein
MIRQSSRIRRRLIRLSRAIARPVYTALLRFTPIVDDWEVIGQFPLKPIIFGSGSTRPFEYYLERTSTVDLDDLDDLASWLRGCTYTSDLAEFGTPDLWQHPVDFERRRRGDCDDHALWAWRKLIELGYSAKLVSGSRGVGHLWVMFPDHAGRTILVESTAKGTRPMYMPHEEVCEDYRPYCAVGPTLECSLYGGYLRALRERYLETGRKKIADYVP